MRELENQIKELRKSKKKRMEDEQLKKCCDLRTVTD